MKPNVLCATHLWDVFERDSMGRKCELNVGEVAWLGIAFRVPLFCL